MMPAAQLAGAAPARRTPADDGAVWRARLADSHRREAARTLAAGDHKIGVAARCPSCRGPVLIGATVRIAHAAACAAQARRASRAAARRTAGVRLVTPDAEACALPVSAPAPEPGPRLEGTRRHPHRQRRRGRLRHRSRACTPQTPGERKHGGIRPWVVRHWFVSGSRVSVQGWAGTARSVICRWGRVLVRVELDECPQGWDSPVKLFGLPGIEPLPAPAW
jgi:hypothetical protein